MPALLEVLEPSVVDAESSVIEHSTTLELRLEISDPEVLLELHKRRDSEDRTQFALTALRIGVLSLRAVAGQLDATTVKEAGDRLIADIRELLTVRGADLSNGLAMSLAQYFDPATGALSQKPTQGARTTRMPGPDLFCKSANSFSPPSIAQVSESQTRMVSGAISGSPSFTMSKCA